MDDPRAAEFRAMIARVRAGNEQAAAELVRKYEPLIRREVRLKLEDARLRRVLDSMDVCQSVLASVFVRAASGHYDLEAPSQLVALLASIARNKVASAARGQFRHRRDLRRVETGTDELRGFTSSDPSPSRIVASAELLETFRSRLTEEERRVSELRAEGHAWAEIAARLGGTADSRRQQLARAAARVARQLGIDEVNDREG